MTTPPENNPPTLESIAESQRALTESVAELDQFVRNVALSTIEAMRNLRNDVDGLTAKVDGLRDDISLVKGGHAVSAMRRNISLIADDLGCQLIEELPQGVVVGFAKVAADDGEPDNEVDSFRHADMVLHVRDDKGHPGYIAVEASFTVNGNDVRRAARNAGYLSKYTGVTSYAVVAGVDILSEAQDRIDQGEAHLYRIQPRELQPE